MPSASALALFCLASLALAVVPGPAVTYIVTQSIDKGRRAGLVSALGVASGGLVHVGAATIGLSALIASSATAFTTVKLVGAVYLIVIGIRRILSSEEDTEVQAVPTRHRRLYVQGAVVNVLNPKTALFFLAFLPQFVDAEAPHKALAFLALGLIFIFNGTLWCLGVAAFAARTARQVRQSGRAMRWINRALGGMFVYLGARIALLQAR